MRQREEAGAIPPLFFYIGRGGCWWKTESNESGLRGPRPQEVRLARGWVAGKNPIALKLIVDGKTEVLRI